MRASVPIPTSETPSTFEALGLQGGRTPGEAFNASKKWKIAKPNVIMPAAVRTQASSVRSSARRVWIQGKCADTLPGMVTGVLLATAPDPSPFRAWTDTAISRFA